MYARQPGSRNSIFAFCSVTLVKPTVKTELLFGPFLTTTARLATRVIREVIRGETKGTLISSLLFSFPVDRGVFDVTLFFPFDVIGYGVKARETTIFVPPSLLVCT